MSQISQRQTETFDPAIVDMIVRRVLECLKNADGSTADVTASPVSESLELSERVITLETIRNKLDGVSALVAAPNSIVTPAVRDELNSRRIQLQFKSAKSKSAETAIQSFCVARLSSHFVGTEWLRSFGSPISCCNDDYDQLADNIAVKFSGMKTLCFAAQPYVAVARLNQNPNLRAAYGRTAKDLAEIKSTLDANVLVLDSVQSRREQTELVRLFVTNPKGVAG